MKISTPITKLQKNLVANRKEWAIFVLGLVAGQILTPSSFYKISTLLQGFSVNTLSLLCMLLILLLMILTASVIFLFNDLLRHKKCLKDLAPPGFKIDNYEEYSEGWDSIPD